MADLERKKPIRWDVSTAREIHADICRVAGSREEIALLFGKEQTAQSSGRGKTIHLTDRIILGPFAAKQLAIALGRVMSDYACAFGSPKKTALPSTEADRQEKASDLFCLVKGLDADIGLEHSFQLSEKTLLKNRFLLGISKKEIRQSAQERIVHVCRQLDMPQPLLETFRQCLIDANDVHFGFEENEKSCLYKVCVEFRDSIKEEIRSSNYPSRSFLLHLGFRWDAFDNEIKSVTRHIWHPRLSVVEILSRVSAIFEPGKQRLAFEITENIVGIAAERMSHQDILYLEVAEEGNPQRSFEIDLYGAGLQVGELYDLLSRLGQHYAIPPEQFHDLYDPIKTKRFGHLSGGFSRGGAEFCSISYGLESVYGNQFRQAESCRTDGRTDRVYLS